ncbi:hypothetical protein FWF74_01025 [Candidatus Saccharibacteria bacterium]|nr:hypothetical protein [Candidatus Saccharibacteria bacterium]MCL1963231.1 hypothetical protein [Candidatus Saccharibacteria bacterium]
MDKESVHYSFDGFVAGNIAEMPNIDRGDNKNHRWAYTRLMGEILLQQCKGCVYHDICHMQRMGLARQLLREIKKSSLLYHNNKTVEITTPKCEAFRRNNTDDC